MWFSRLGCGVSPRAPRDRLRKAACLPQVTKPSREPSGWGSTQLPWLLPVLRPYDHTPGPASPSWTLGRTLGSPQRAMAQTGEKACLPGLRAPPSSHEFANPKAKQGGPRPPKLAAAAHAPCPGATGHPGLGGGRAAGRTGRGGRRQEGEMEQEREETAPPCRHLCQSRCLTAGMSQAWNAKWEPWKVLGATVHLGR